MQTTSKYKHIHVIVGNTGETDHCRWLCDGWQITDIQQEHQREMEGLLENVRQLSRELRQQLLIIDQFIPVDYQVSAYLKPFFLKCVILYCRVSQ